MKNNTSNNNTKLILLHPYIQKQGTSHRLWLLAFLSFFTLAFLLTLIYTRQSTALTTSATVTATAINHHHPTPLPDPVLKALLHYASTPNATATADHMSAADLKTISAALRQCPAPCNLLVFGLSHETLLWNALNHRGRTVFIDENRYYAAYFEEQNPEIEAYDVQYTTKLSETGDLIATARELSRNECRPVQNLLFSDCKLGLNDLPNQLYELDWDVILVDGPRGYWADAPGRVSAIFTAAVLARSKKGGNAKTHVFVHDFNTEVDRVSSEEFLCKENLVKAKGRLGHFVLERMEEGSFQFCRNRTTALPVPASSS
ncbi:Protein IRX15-LIKE like [Actinidia chinensis var. chinensis]|uniref:Protein IRX15-LIKE like n=1 Tax=Actinidia chinensis var. chinensis TaxID=1590841 RepID=A0A2R6PAF9_ACTCC|nr:Protein IRX15-LIKE like [Actinidia chinensis var. chinensis]